jgi:leucyl/phenylalanyl-tRNA--protein transferase
MDEVVAWSDDLRPEPLLDAYARGVFPWPQTARGPIPWVSPDPRAVLEFDRLHVPRSLRQVAARSGLRLSIDEDFAGVIAACARVSRPGQRSTWITPAMEAAYVRLHELGRAHSVEAWSGTRLVGGVYGVDAGGAFCGESMFHEAPNASKLALLHLVEHLRARGAEWLDIQMLTPHLEALGARGIPRAEYLRLLAAARARGRRLF